MKNYEIPSEHRIVLFYSEGDQALVQVAQKATRNGSGQLALRDPAWIGGLDLDDLNRSLTTSTILWIYDFLQFFSPYFVINACLKDNVYIIIL